MPKGKIETGDYVLNENGYTGKVYSIDGSRFLVVDEDGDELDWRIDDCEYIEKEEAEKSYIIFPKLTNDFPGVIDVKQNKLIVGCQRIPFESIEEVYKAMKAISEA